MNARADLVELLRAIVRNELAHMHLAEIGVVTRTHPHASESDKKNYACDVKLRDSGLELKAVPVATQRIGAAAIPNIEDLVLVAFVGGDIHGAVIVGRLYNDVDRAPVAADHEWVYVSPDSKKSGVRRAHFEFPNGNTATLEDDKLVVEMGSTRLSIKNGGDVELQSAGKVVMRSDADFEIKASGNLAIEAGGSIAIKASTDAKLEGLSVAFQAQTSAEVKGSAAASLKGPLVTIGGNVSFSAS